jgi:hypothetical protein
MKKVRSQPDYSRQPWGWQSREKRSVLKDSSNLGGGGKKGWKSEVKVEDEEKEEGTKREEREGKR